jgi:hypothetical protein
MSSEVALEIENLYQVVVDMLGSDRPVDFDHGLPLYSVECSERQIEEIRHGLEQKLARIHSSAVPVVTVLQAVEDGQAPVLRVRFFELYRKDQSGQNWYVDMPDEACWYFMTAEERSAVALCRYWNTPLNRGYLESVRFDIRAERSALRLRLLQLRDAGIQVTKFGYKSDGLFEDVS